MKYLIVGFLVLMLSGCGYDPGGNIFDTAWLAKRAAQSQSNAPIVIDYQCDSRCTHQLADKDTCMKPSGSIGVHAADLNGVANEYWTQYVFSMYNRYPKFQEAIRRDGAMASLRVTVYDADQMHAFGVPLCH